MSVLNLQIDDLLKLKLTSLMEDFENHRISNKVIAIKKEAIIINETTTIKKEKKTESFFHKFFFSDYQN